MNGGAQPKIVISPDELRDPRIDEAIEMLLARPFRAEG